MSHITACTPSSPPSPPPLLCLPPPLAGPWPRLQCSQLSARSRAPVKREALFLPGPNVFKDSNECNAVTQKMDFREGEGGGEGRWRGGGEKSNLAFVAEHYHFTPLPSSSPRPRAPPCARACARVFMCDESVSACALFFFFFLHLPLCVSPRAYVAECTRVNS